MQHDEITRFVEHAWDVDIVPALEAFVRIPNLSPGFDPAWAEHGHMAAAVELARDWSARRAIDGATVEVRALPGRTPVLLIDIPATDGGADGDTVLLYGHLDKQPPFEGWTNGRGPWEPVWEGDRLYGRGVADDGYAAFAALAAVEAVRAAGGRHHRCLVLIEASEESGSPDLPAHLDVLGNRLGTPSLVIGLDSGMADWDHLWVTTSLRGLVNLVVTVRVLTEGMHSGSAGGVVPSSFRILRGLLDRIEDAHTGRILVPSLHAEVPAQRRAEIDAIAPLLGDLVAPYPFADGVQPQHDDVAALLTARAWGPSLEITGIEGAARPADAGNVLRPFTTAKLSLRLPPTVDATTAAADLLGVLTESPPYGAVVTGEIDAAESGWAASPTAEWLAAALDHAGATVFGRPPRAHGEGGTIPFMGMLGARFPDAQFVITGVLGPGSNAHGPNEFLDLPTAKRITATVAHLLDAHARRP